MSPDEVRQIIREELDKDKETYLDWFGKIHTNTEYNKELFNLLSEKVDDTRDAMRQAGFAQYLNSTD